MNSRPKERREGSTRVSGGGNSKGQGPEVGVCWQAGGTAEGPVRLDRMRGQWLEGRWRGGPRMGRARPVGLAGYFDFETEG